MTTPDDPTRPDDETSDDSPDAWAEADRAYAQKWGDAGADQSDGDLGALSAEPDPFSPTPRHLPTGETTALYVSGRKRKVPLSTPVGAYGHGMVAAGPYLGLGVQIAASMAVFTGAGYALDLWLGSTPWGLLTGAALGMVGIVALIVRVAREADARKPGRK